METQTYIDDEKIIRAKRIISIPGFSDVLLIANRITERYYLKRITRLLGFGYRYITEVVYIDEFDQTTTTFTHDVRKIQSIKQWKKVHEKV